jgi:hypothetical protein
LVLCFPCCCQGLCLLLRLLLRRLACGCQASLQHLPCFLNITQLGLRCCQLCYQGLL